jgi:hypothetical protein
MGYVFVVCWKHSEALAMKSGEKYAKFAKPVWIAVPVTRIARNAA